MKKAVPLLVGSLLALVVLSLWGCFASSSGGPHFLYVGNTASPTTMSAFTAESGNLTAITGSPFDTAGNSPLALAAVSNTFLYAAVPSSGPAGGILLMPVQSGGSLGAAQLLASGGDYDGIAVTPNGKFLYTADVAGSRVVAFSINANTGALTGIGPQGPPPGVGVGPDPFNLAVDPQGKFLFVASCGCSVPANLGLGAIWAFSVNADGTLTTVPGSPFSLPAAGSTPQPSDLVVSPDGTLLFVASYDDKVYVENINAVSGALSSAGTVSLPTGSAPGSVRTSTDGKFVYTADGGTDNLSMLSVGAGGALTDLGEVAVGGAPAVVLADPSGGFLYATSFDQNSVVVYSIGSDGRLTQTTSVSTGGTSPFGLASSH